MLWRILRDRRFVLRSTLLVLAEKTEIFLNQAREILICVEREWENNEHVMFSNNTCNFWYFTLIFHSSKRHIKHFSWVCLYWRVIHFSIYDINSFANGNQFIRNASIHIAMPCFIWFFIEILYFTHVFNQYMRLNLFKKSLYLDSFKEKYEYKCNIIEPF